MGIAGYPTTNSLAAAGAIGCVDSVSGGGSPTPSGLVCSTRRRARSRWARSTRPSIGSGPAKTTSRTRNLRVVSAAVGYVTVKYFVRYLAAHSLNVFAYYLTALAAITVL